MPTALPTALSGPARIRSWAVLVALLGIHLVMTIRLFPTWEAIADERPVVMVDHTIHLYHGALGAGFVRTHGTTWGYDPFFMAGYPETPVWDSSSNLSIAFQLAAGGRYSPRAYKIGLFACTFLVVALLPAGAFAAGLGRAEATTATALGLVVFWGCFPIVLWKSGLFAFVTASAALGLVLGMLLRFERRPGPGRFFALATVGAVFLFAHVTAPVMAMGGAFGYIAAVVSSWRQRRKQLGAVIGAVALALTVNAFWVVPLWRFRGIRTQAYSFLTTDSAWYLGTYFLFDPIDGHMSLALLVVGAAGLVWWWTDGDRARAALFGGAAVVLLALAWVGSLWSVSKTLEPLRFRVTLDLLMTVPAGSALARGSAWLSRRGGGEVRRRLLWAGVVSVLSIGAWAASPLTIPGIAGRFARLRPLVVGLPRGADTLVGWLKAETDLSARVLFEDQLRLLERTDPESTHWTPLLPTLLGSEGRVFVGGLYQTAFIAHHHAAAYGDYQLGDRRIDAWRPDELDAYCTRYNIGWIVCWSPLSKFWFDRYPRARSVATLRRAVSPGMSICQDPVQARALIKLAGPDVALNYLVNDEGVGSYKIYRVERPHSYFLEGTGRVTSFAANRVELTDVRPDPRTGAAVLSLHWLDTWKTEPRLSISPVRVLGDPVAFVRIALDGPAPRVVLFNGY